MTEHYLIARVNPKRPYVRLCACGDRWFVTYSVCHSFVRHDDKGHVMVDKQAMMSRDDFVKRFRDHYTPILGAELVEGILDTAISVEGGYEFDYLMSPYAKDMFGEAADAIWW